MAVKTLHQLVKPYPRMKEPNRFANGMRKTFHVDPIHDKKKDLVERIKEKGSSGHHHSI